MIEAEFDEIEDTGGELDLTEADSLPWLEADEEDERPGGVDTAQIAGFIALLVAVLLVVIGLVWFVSNRDSNAVLLADGSTIEAPEGPYKVRPDEAGGKEFSGTGDVAPGVGEGQAPEARMGNATGAGAGDQDLNIAMPPIGGGAPAVEEGASGAGASDPGSSAASNAGSTAAETSDAGSATGSGAGAATGGVGVQLAAYSSKARAEKGWRELQRKSSALEGVNYRIVEGQIDIGTVYRLQAVSGNRPAAEALCRTLKSQGLDCQVKP